MATPKPKSGMHEWDKIRSLRNFIKQKRQSGFFIFSATHLDNTDMMEAFHDEYLAKLGRKANLAEQAANEQYKKR